MSGCASPDSRPLRERKKQHTSQRIHKEALRLALEAGSASQVTVRAICEAAEVSQRTFFNYYSSKPAAVLGIPGLSIPQEVRATFLSGEGDLVDDLCILIAGIIDDSGVGPEDHRGVKHLLRQDPELGFQMFSLLRSFRAELRDLVGTRSDLRTAGMVVALVFTAMPFCYFPAEGDDPSDRLLDRLRRSVKEIQHL
ncbi:MAG: TetR/AcrR family transcriptional regulator [Microbacteriaceae bacterium]|jgi:AcrR family transcriptional regulator|nr:TetR/AcrR family transcriptional regulator [Microbacteriaceae bacterium]